MEIQRTLGSDIAMVLDECIPYPSPYDYAKASTSLTIRWARRSLEQRQETDPALFAIVQGGMYRDLREESAQALVKMDFQGYAIGGVSVGEPKSLMRSVLEWTTPFPSGECTPVLDGCWNTRGYPRCGDGWGSISSIASSRHGMPEMERFLLPTERCRSNRLNMRRTEGLSMKHVLVTLAAIIPGPISVIFIWPMKFCLRG